MGVACQHKASPSDEVAQSKPIRISDKYSRAAVDSYDIFEGKITQHHFAMIRLVSGESFPMVCRIADGGVYPIPQSVFSAGGNVTSWHIMCEPRIDHAHALMSLNISSKDGTLQVGRDKLERLANKPKLLHRPRPPFQNPKS